HGDRAPARAHRELESSRRVRRRVDVLALDQAVLEREDVDSVPLEPPAVAGRLRRPLAHDETIARVQTPAREAQVRRVLEDAGDVAAYRLALRTLSGRVAFEHHVRRVQRDDRVDVLPVPGVVVAADAPL